MTSREPAKSKKTEAQDAEAKPAEQKRKKTLMGTFREWTDAIIIAYVLAMFIRTFVVELFKIPSGSMTPTLVGDYAAEVDYNDDGQKDLLILKPPFNEASDYQVFLRNGDGWTYEGEKRIPTQEIFQLGLDQANGLKRKLYSLVGYKGPIKKRNDKIFVNKFAYWFKQPDRGDLIVFKVPETIFTEDRPIYIKRAVGFQGETISFEPSNDCVPGKGRLAVNGNIVEDPAVFKQLCYEWEIGLLGRELPPENEYARQGGFLRFVQSQVPKGHLLALGDNTDYSSDGRYWGSVPLENLKGKAFFRYSPLSKMGFLH